MNFTEFYCDSVNGSNLNAGSTTSGTADYTFASGNWVSSTRVFTLASGNTTGVTTGMWACLYADGASVGAYWGRISAVTSTTITIDSTAKVGSLTDGTGNRTCKIGGCLKGPNGTSGVPLSNFSQVMKNASSHYPRINLKNNGTYSVTAAITGSTSRVEGYTSTPGDGGQAVIDGGSSGAAYILYAAQGQTVKNVTFQNNGATGEAALVTASTTNFINCIFKNSRGNGMLAIQKVVMISCLAESNNASNTANRAGIFADVDYTGTKFGVTIFNCVSRNNTGSNTIGFIGGSGTNFVNCIAYGNGFHGFSSNNNTGYFCIHCDSYNNTGSGYYFSGTTMGQGFGLINCNATKNGRYGVEHAGDTSSIAILRNLGLGAGTEANSSGNYSHTLYHDNSGAVSYASNSSPYTTPGSGDFLIALAAAKSAGYGTFGISTTTATPDIGAAQASSSGGGGGSTVIIRRGLGG